MSDENILDVMKRCECKANAVRRCFRCEGYDHEDAGQMKDDEWYCNNCYDHMFVGWAKPKES